MLLFFGLRALACPVLEEQVLGVLLRQVGWFFLFDLVILHYLLQLCIIFGMLLLLVSQSANIVLRETVV